MLSKFGCRRKKTAFLYVGTWGWLAVRTIAGAILAVHVVTSSAFAQSSGYDTEEDETYQRPLTKRERICVGLEQRLVEASQQRTNGRSMLPRLHNERRKFERKYQQAQARAERSNCYDYFLFSKTLRRTRRCIKLDRKIKSSRLRLAEIQRDIKNIRDRRSAGAQREDLLDQLARYRCGAIYQRTARKRRRTNSWNPLEMIFGRENGGFNNGGFFDNAPRELPPENGIIADATYRTMCVRTCDGYYFPVSFSTLPSKFDKDSAACQSKCAAPAELFVYRNPGGEVEQMTSLSGLPYSKTDFAFRYRKEYVKGCSCRVADYDPVALQEKQDTANADTSDGDGATNTTTTN